MVQVSLGRTSRSPSIPEPSWWSYISTTIILILGSHATAPDNNVQKQPIQLLDKISHHHFVILEQLERLRR